MLDFITTILINIYKWFLMFSKFIFLKTNLHNMVYKADWSNHLNVRYFFSAWNGVVYLWFKLVCMKLLELFELIFRTEYHLWFLIHLLFFRVTYILCSSVVCQTQRKWLLSFLFDILQHIFLHSFFSLD